MKGDIMRIIVAVVVLILRFFLANAKKKRQEQGKYRIDGKDIIILVLLVYIFWSPIKNSIARSITVHVYHSFPAKEPLATEFNVAGVTKKRYKNFLSNLRNNLADGSKQNHPEVLILPDLSSFARKGQQHQRLHLVILSNLLETSVDLILDRVDAYIIGYKVGDKCYLLKDNQQDNDYRKDVYSYIKDLHRNAETLELGTSYCDHKSRLNIELGISKLQKAITTLKDTDTTQAGYRNSVSEALLVCIQMVSEAARFSYIEDKVCNTIIETEIEYISFERDDTMIELEKNWEDLSTAVHTSNYKLVKEKFRERHGEYIKYLKLLKIKGNVGNEAGTSQPRGKSNSVGISGMPPQLGKNTKEKKKIKASSTKQNKFRR